MDTRICGQPTCTLADVYICFTPDCIFQLIVPAKEFSSVFRGCEELIAVGRYFMVSGGPLAFAIIGSVGYPQAAKLEGVVPHQEQGFGSTSSIQFMFDHWRTGRGHVRTPSKFHEVVGIIDRYDSIQ